MKKVLCYLSIATAFLCTTSCIWNNSIDPDPEKPDVITLGGYVLNQGNWNSNDAEITLFDATTGQVINNCFETINGLKLGDTATDIYIFGTKMYIAVSNSGIIFVTDKLNCKVIGQIRAQATEGGENLSPRYFTSFKDKLYVSYYEGYVAKIDTTSYKVEQIQKVGMNPENIVTANNKIYVANSGGLSYPDYDNTVMALNPDNLQVTSTIEVGQNPCWMQVDNENEVYVISLGNYADIPAQLQKIDPNGNVEVMESVSNPYTMSMGPENYLYIITSYYDENWEAKTDLIVFNANASVENSMGSFLPGGEVKNPYSITVDTNTWCIYVGESDYTSSGSIKIFSRTGEKLTSFSTEALNPWRIAFVRNL